MFHNTVASAVCWWGAGFVACTRCGKPRRGDEDVTFNFPFDMLQSASEVHLSGQAIFDERQTSLARRGNGVFWWKISIDWRMDHAHTFCTALEGILDHAGWMTAPGTRGRVGLIWFLVVPSLWLWHIDSLHKGFLSHHLKLQVSH
jgi:hypothetical protein